MDRLIQAALKSKPVAWFSPTQKFMADTWRELRSVLAPITRDKSEQEKRLELINGGVIDLWSLDSTDSGRGRKYALAVIDEAAMTPNLAEAWQQSIRPTLTDMLGSAWFLSTPKGMNYFKTLFDHGQDPNRPHHEYVIGCDWGRSHDYTVYMVLDVTTRSVVGMDRSNRVEYAIQCDRLKRLSELWQPRQIIAEQNGMGGPIIEQLTRDGQPFITSNFQQNSHYPIFSTCLRTRGDSHFESSGAGE